MWPVTCPPEQVDAVTGAGVGACCDEFTGLQHYDLCVDVQVHLELILDIRSDIAWCWQVTTGDVSVVDRRLEPVPEPRSFEQRLRGVDIEVVPALTLTTELNRAWREV